MPFNLQLAVTDLRLARFPPRSPSQIDTAPLPRLSSMASREIFMTWHYAIDRERRGPVSEEEFQRLVGRGVITPETLVWRDGMADWAPFGAGVANLPPLPFRGAGP